METQSSVDQCLSENGLGRPVISVITEDRSGQLYHNAVQVQPKISSSFRRIVYCGIILVLLFFLLASTSSTMHISTGKMSTGGILQRRESSKARSQSPLALHLPPPGEHHESVAQNHLLSPDLKGLDERTIIGSRLMLLPSGDGFGTHLLGLLSVLAYCRAKNLTYVHRPWDHVGHTPRGVPIALWSSDLEAFTGLTRNETLVSDISGPVPAIKWVGLGSDVNSYFNDKFLKDMRMRYLAPTLKNHSASFRATQGSVRVAIHIRRGDVSQSMVDRYTNNTQTLRFMDHVQRETKKTNPSRPITFHIYSQGEEPSFDDIVDAYGTDRIFLHLNEDLKVTFYDMTGADVLVMAKSGFSYAAALLSAGIVYYQPFWKPPLCTWKRLHLVSELL